MKRTKAGQLLKVAVAAHRRNETEIAREIFVLAMEEEDLDEYMQYMDEEAPEGLEESEEDLKEALESAMDAGDYEGAEEALMKLRGMTKAEDEGDLDLDDEGLEDSLEDLGDDLEDLEEGLDDLGDDLEAEEDPDDEEPLAYSLSDAQVASVTRVAARIRKAGHKDLARKITSKLGL